MADQAQNNTTKNGPGLLAKAGAFLGAPDKILTMGAGAVVMAALLLPLTCREVKPGKTIVISHTDTLRTHTADTLRKTVPYYIFAHDTTVRIHNVTIASNGDSLSISSLEEHDTVRVVRQDSIIRHDTLEYKLPDALKVRRFADASTGLFGPPARVALGVSFTILGKYEPYSQIEYQSTTKSGIRVGLRLYF